MNEIIFMILTLIAGLILGGLFFGGLWLTVKKMTTSKIPTLWVLGSFLLRVSITLTGFYFLTFGNWQRLLICISGFIAARYLITYFTKLNKEKQMVIKKETDYEA
jgi:F1F0 ATPase subunit 2